MSLVQQIQRGQADPKFTRVRKKYGKLETVSLSIDYQVNGVAELRTLCIALSEHTEEFQDLADALEAYYKRIQIEEMKDLEGAYLDKQWAFADADKSGTLEEGEIFTLLGKLNMSFSRDVTRKFFKESDKDNSGNIDKEEFKIMLQRLKYRKEIDNLMFLLIKSYKENAAHILPEDWCEQLAGEKEVHIDHLLMGDDDIPLEVFNRFEYEIQKDPSITNQQLRIFDPMHDGKTIGLRAFDAYLNSPTNEAMDPAKLTCYQDMSRPLSHYWCASSHNTYLDGGQLTSNSSVQRYISDLQGGCRCVELDCWDGPDNDPIIYHGHTLTSKIRFEDAIKGIAANAFRTSEFPVILSLENHCSVVQQNVMQSMMKKHFGEMLCRPELTADGELPPLNSLCRKIVLKGKVSKATALASGVEQGEASDSEDEDDEAQKRMIQSSMKHIKMERKLVEVAEEDEEVAPGQMIFDEAAERPPLQRTSTTPLSTEGKVVATPEERLPQRSSLSLWSSGEKKKKDTKEKKAKVDAELSAVTFLAGVKFKSFEESKATAAANEMSSFSENKTEKLMEKGLSAQWVDYNSRQMSRIYPAGLRVDSSNYDPVPSWCMGSQIVALNYQTDGIPMQLNDGKFEENGKCGYLLKPPCLLDRTQPFDIITGPFPNPETISITIISACQLPKPYASTKGEVIDPFVQLDVNGVEPDRATFKTEVIQDNGFNPVWNQKFTFKLNAPDLALLQFTVYDHEDLAAPRFIGTRVIARSCLRPGLRNVSLRDFSGETRGDFRFAKILCYIDFGS